MSTMFNEKKIVKAYTGAPRCMSVRAEHEPDGGYWITDGYTGVRIHTPEEWRSIGGAIFGEAAGEYTRDNKSGQVTPNTGGDTMAKTLSDMLAAPGCEANVAPFAFQLDRKTAVRGLYDAENDVAVVINAAFLEYFDNCKFYVSSATKPVIVRVGDTVVGIILPVRPRPEQVAAVRAFYGKAEAVKAEQKAEAARIDEAVFEGAKKKIAELNARIAELENADMPENGETLLRLEHENDALRANLAEATARIAELEKRLAHKPAPAPEHDPASAAHEAVKMFKLINGKIHAVIKGENTDAPVVWLDNIDGIAAADLEKAGAAYSNKRGAWYYRVTARA